MLYLMIDNFVYGGAERQAKYLLENNIGFDELILLENYMKYQLQSSIPVSFIYPGVLKIHQRPIKDKRAVKVLNDKFKKNDRVVSFLERSNILNIKSSTKTGHKSIISVRNYLSERYGDKKYSYRMYLIKKYYPKADLVIANSIKSKEDLIINFNVPEEKIRVIYNLIDIEKIKILKEEKIKDEYKKIFESPVILNIGSLTPQKSQKQLIKAFKEVKKSNPKHKLVIIGTGKLERDLKKLIKEENLVNEVFLLGNTNNPFKYLNRSELFVLNSKFEGFPNVLLEALAVGVPVVSKNCLSGPSEMLELPHYNNDKLKLTKYGVIFPRQSANINKEDEYGFLIDAINKMIDIKKQDSNHYNNLKVNCVSRSKNFSIENILSEWIKKINY